MRPWVIALVLAGGCAAFDDAPPDGDDMDPASRDAGSSQDAGRADRDAQSDEDPANMGAAGSASGPGSPPPSGPQPTEPGTPTLPDAGQSVPTPPADIPPGTCGQLRIQRDVPSCDFDVSPPIEADGECMSVVIVAGKAVECDGEDGWELVNPMRIRLNGAACATVLSDATTQVSMFVGCGAPLS